MFVLHCIWPLDRLNLDVVFALTVNEGAMSFNRKKLRLGFIGGGLSSSVGWAHYSACQMDGIWELYAGSFSRNENINSNTAKEWGINPDHLYKNWSDMIKQEKQNLDAVCVLTDTPSHCEIVMGLLECNIPVICEKSLVMDMDEIKKIKSCYSPEQHFLVSIFNYTGYPMIRELREKIENDELGSIQQVHIEMPQEGLIRPPSIAGKSAPPQNWRLSDGQIPTICLDLGVHIHNLISFLTKQEPSEVLAEFGNYSEYKGLVDYITMFLRFPNNMKSSIWMTKTALGHRNGLRIRLYGTKASAQWYQMEPELLEISTLDGRKEILDRSQDSHVAGKVRYNRFKSGHPAGFIEALANLYVDIADKLVAFQSGKVDNNPFVYGLDGSEKGLNLFHCAVKSQQSESWEMIQQP